jgi:glutamine synthetase
MLIATNPSEKGAPPVARKVKQTIEFRAADGTAAVQLLLTGLILAVENGLRDDSSLKVTEELYVAEKETLREGLEFLPLSCQEAAEALTKDRKHYEGTLPAGLIDYIIKDLRNCKEEDELISKRDEKKDELKKLVEKYLHY